MQRFDYEVETAYSLVIQATNTAPPGNFTTATVEVSIRDINDNPPIFSMPSGYTLRIAEGTLVGTPVGTVVATDNDGGVNGTVRIKNLHGISLINNLYFFYRWSMIFQLPLLHLFCQHLPLVTAAESCPSFNHWTLREKEVTPFGLSPETVLLNDL